jgi:hypothetical protein
MTEQPEGMTFIEQIEADPRGAAEFAVADAQLRLEELLDHAIRDASGIDIGSIAETLRVSPERVKRILEGEDPLRFESFIRYLSAIGRTVRIDLVPKALDFTPALVDHFEQLGATIAGPKKILWHREVEEIELEPMESMRYVGTSDIKTGTMSYDENRVRFTEDYRLGGESEGRHATPRGKGTRTRV